MRALVLTCMLVLLFADASPALIADHVAVEEFNLIPADQFDAIRENHNFFYGHTSHGSQIMSGLTILHDEDPPLYTAPPFHEISDDLGHNGDTSWVQPTRDYLDSNPECNSVMWSWCGGCSDNSQEGINTYLNAMNELELEYSQVLFIYMTGHLDGGGPEGDLYRSNNQIRDYCIANDKVLFDFGDIESWDPDGNYYPDESDGCGWCSDWCSSNPCPDCASCAHSHCFNCYLKGKAFWWMMAKVNGWNPTVVDDEQVAAVVRLEQNHPNPFNPRTEIRFQLANAGTVSLDIYRIDGQRVACLFDGVLDAGEHGFSFDGCDVAGHELSSGIYLYSLRSEAGTFNRKMTLVR